MAGQAEPGTAGSPRSPVGFPQCHESPVTRAVEADRVTSAQSLGVTEGIRQEVRLVLLASLLILSPGDLQ